MQYVTFSIHAEQPSLIKNNLYMQSWEADLLTGQSCLQSRGKPDKQFLSKAKNIKTVMQKTKIVHNCLVKLTNNYLIKSKTIKNSYVKNQSHKQPIDL